MKPDNLKVVVFDWGDTLMVNYPQYGGPMADWPQVAAVDGALETLGRLKDTYRLAVATNAQDSSAILVRSALARVGLDGLVEAVYTTHELGGARKPERLFFQRLQQALGVSAEALAMVGDDPVGDIGGADGAGWRSVWLNPEGKSAPGLLPLYSAEIQALADLPAAIVQMTLPDLATARSWMLGQGATGNLLAHVEMVAAFAYQIALWLRSAGEFVDPLLAHRGGILHDLAKLSARGGPVNHGDLAGRLLDELGQPQCAAIARTHMLFNLLDPAKAPRTWEQILVYYADKLVENGRLVSIETRLEALRERYNIDPLLLSRVGAALNELEAQVCATLGWTPGELLTNLNTAYLRGG